MITVMRVQVLLTRLFTFVKRNTDNQVTVSFAEAPSATQDYKV